MSEPVPLLFRKAVNAHQSGALPKAEKLYVSVLKAEPRHPDARYNLALVLLHAGRWKEALANLDKLVEQGARAAHVCFSRGRALSMLGRHPEALAALQEASRLKPGEPQTLLEIGNELMTLQRLPEAIQSFRAAYQAAPKYLEAIGALGQALVVAHEFQAAVDLLTAYLAANPEDHRILMIRGQAQFCLGEYDAALESLQRVAALRPDDWTARMFALYAARESGRWDLEAEIFDAHRKALERSSGPDDGPIAAQGLLYFPFRPDELLKLAAGRYKRLKASIRHYPPLAAPAVAPVRDTGPIRLGYFSADFRRHPIMQLSVDLLASHDRRRFSVHAYNVGPLDDSEWQHRAMRAVDSFTDLAGNDAHSAATRIKQDRIDVLIDFSLYAQYARPEIPAMRPAPLQMQWLGFSGTSGGDAYDYIVVDQTIVPEPDARFYSERLFWMPDCFLPNRRLEPIPEAPSRAEMGLPEGAFVFCCFNLPKKLDRETLAAWLRILKAVDNSVLWLLEMDETMKSSLRQAFTAAGLDPARLIIATRLPLDQHLARHRCADLFLDNFIYGAQTTACDALRAGLPLLTLYGSTFVSRASASVLAAAGLPELICHDLATYEETALALARDPAKLAGFRQRLNETRETAPLFDVDRFRRNFEAGLEHIVAAARAGRKPANVSVRDLLHDGGR